MTAKNKFGPILEKLQHFQDGIVTSPGHTVPTKTFAAVKPLCTKPPTVPKAHKRGPRPGTLLRRAKVVPIDGKWFSSVTVEDAEYSNFNLRNFLKRVL